MQDTPSTYEGLQLGLVHRLKAAAAPRAPRDVAALSNADLLTLLLGTSREGSCKQLAASNDLRSIATTPSMELRKHGFTTSAIERLTAIFELAKRYGETPWKVGEPLKSSGDIYAHFRERLAAAVIEHFYAILLDNKHRKIRDILVSLGSLTASIVHPRDVFLPVVQFSAAAVAFVHNHPSGDPVPSKEDIEITRRLREVGDVIGVRVLDHIIVGRGRYVSMVDDGYW